MIASKLPRRAASNTCWLQRTLSNCAGHLDVGLDLVLGDVAAKPMGYVPAQRDLSSIRKVETAEELLDVLHASRRRLTAIKAWMREGLESLERGTSKAGYGATTDCPSNRSILAPKTSC